jgi:hypothetical protein
MYRTVRLLLVVCALVPCANLWAADPAPETKPLMTERSKLLFSDDLNRPLGNEWRAAKGKWEVVDGAVRGSERKADMHGAVARHAMPFHNVLIQYSFKLEGAKRTTLSVNAAKGHLCRVLIDPAGFRVQKDDTDKDGPDKAVILETRSTPIKLGEWHTILVEIRGQEMLASLDGKEVAFGAHAAIDVPKANFGLTVAGESVSFKNLRVWEALPNKHWEATRAKLLQARAKASADGK